jgi:hypothetical protein
MPLRIEIVVDPQIGVTMMQQPTSITVYSGMNQSNLIALAILVASLTACASSEPRAQNREPSASEIAQIIGCAPNEVALCIEVNCELEEWRCADSDDVRKMFRAGDFNR